MGSARRQVIELASVRREFRRQRMKQLGAAFAGFVVAALLTGAIGAAVAWNICR